MKAKTALVTLSALAVIFLPAAGLAGPPQSIESLKERLAERPGDPGIRMALGIEYYRAGNDFWAVKTFQGLVSENGGDCTARAWLGLAFLRRAFPKDALDAVTNLPEGASCSAPGMLRLKMVQSLAEKALGRDGDAMESARAASRLASGWAPDVEALPEVTRRASPDSVPEVSWSLEAAGGWTSNARMGSATDEGLSGAASASALSTLDARVRIVPDFGGLVRPVLEVQPRFQWFFAQDATKLSFLELTGQVGILIRSRLPRVFVGYRPDWLMLPEGFRAETGPVPYMMGHRGEFEIEVMPGLMVFGGAGKRIFHEMSRTRAEVDAGVGGSSAPARGLTVLWAAGARYYDAAYRAWDLIGGSASSAFVMQLPHDMAARVSATLSLDWYPWSAATASADPFNSVEARRDLFLKTGWQFWSPSIAGTRFGVSYDFSYRDSTADMYSFTDHRVLLRFRWNGTASMRRPRAAALPEGVEPVDWGGDGAGGLDERVRDMLRQDEQVQRSSSCVN